MSGFPLLNPPYHLVEKIIRKVEQKSNFRLRQTCHDVYDFIKTNPNISNIGIGGEYSMVIKEEDSSLQLCRRGYPSNFDNPPKVREFDNRTPVDIEGYYGAQLGLLYPPSQTKETWSPFCEFFKKYRLTCCQIRFSDGLWTTEQWTTVVQLLKPAYIFCTSQNPSDLKEIFSCKTLKYAGVDVREENAIIAMETLLPLLPDVMISLDSSNDRFTLIRSVLQQLFSMPLQNLKRFRFSFDGPEISREELEQEFPELHWVYKLEIDKHDTKEDISAVVKLPSQFPTESSCKVAVETGIDGPWYTYIIHYQAEKSLP